jgi:hypothetical protein
MTAVAALLLAAVCAARADYETQRWYFGDYPSRVGIVGINNEWTRICLGEERVWVDRRIGPFEFHVHPYVVVGIMSGTLLVIVFAAFFRRLYGRRCVKVV